MGFFTVEVKPTIPASEQAGNSSVYSAGDILFDWTSFQIPKGASKYLGATVIFRGKNGGKQTVSDVDIFFAKTIDRVAPLTIGASNTSASCGPVVSNHIIGMTRLDDGGSFGESAFNRFSVASTGGSSEPSLPAGLVIQGEPDTGDNVGYDTVYIAALTGTAIDFGTTVLARGGEAAGVTVVETDKGSDDDPNAETIFAVGDVLHSATDDVLGTVASIAAFGSSKQDITFAAVTPDIIADNEEIFNINPIRIVLSFEK
tara:strand:+ start:38 stop:811 length:774 start_codon:yes stop_codon:yes gene_type:complete